ncbi:MAG: sulfite exporter TauE/SafE family protein, partial [Betaproteobacteria bacterium]|nr:sulfite exporter TauE/SafE family protein [Betaproteobacteria bacterium]
VGSFLKGLTTLGLGLVVVPVLTTVLDPVTAVLTLFLAKAVSDALMAVETRHDRILALWGRIGYFLSAGLLGVVVGTVFLATLPKRALFFVIGVLIVGFVAMHLLGRNVELRPHHQRPFALLAGVVSGAGQGISGMSGPILTIYAYSLNLTPRQFVFVTSVLYSMINIGQFVAILYFGLYDATRLMLAALAVPPMLVGTFAGIALRNRLSADTFRIAVLALMAAVGVTLIWRGLGL